jgi:acetylglutamate kinase
VQEAISKASVLIEALPYIQAYDRKIVVVKLGGSVMDNPAAERELLRDIVFMNSVGMQPIIVHGGGKEISKAMDEAGLEPVFVQGLRYTDERTLAIAEQALCARINHRIVDALNSMGVEALALHSLTSCVLFAQRLYLSGDDGRRIDIGHVGQVQEVNAKILQLLCQADTIPVIAPIARDHSGGKLNVNADTAADTSPPPSTPRNSSWSPIPMASAPTRTTPTPLPIPQPTGNRRPHARGIIDKGMIPKVRLPPGTRRRNRKAHIIDGRIPHSLLLEIFTDKGVGTQIQP